MSSALLSEVRQAFREPVKVALYRGIGLISSLIEFATRSPYSHAAFLFDEDAAVIAEQMASRSRFKKLHLRHTGAVVEAWQGGVKNSLSLSALHHTGTPVDIFHLVDPLDFAAQSALLALLDEQIGDPYSYWNVLRFLTRRPGKEDGSWFCSELVFADFAQVGRPFLQRTEPWEVPPGWLARVPGLAFERTILTS